MDAELRQITDVFSRLPADERRKVVESVDGPSRGGQVASGNFTPLPASSGAFRLPVRVVRIRDDA